MTTHTSVIFNWWLCFPSLVWCCWRILPSCSFLLRSAVGIRFNQLQLEQNESLENRVRRKKRVPGTNEWNGVPSCHFERLAAVVSHGQHTSLHQHIGTTQKWDYRLWGFGPWRHTYPSILGHFSKRRSLSSPRAMCLFLACRKCSSFSLLSCWEEAVQSKIQFHHSSKRSPLCKNHSGLAHQELRSKGLWQSLIRVEPIFFKTTQ